eukprot:m.155853 g.155853  ORF g.155853 m.155853 type:complete len:322 (-) comp23589_c0_seq1:242-1207(-)
MRTSVVLGLLAVVAVAFPIDVHSASIVSANRPISATAGNGSCITPQQEKQLDEAIHTIGDLFKTAIAALDIAFEVEKDPTTKQDLGIAIRVLEAVNQDVLANLTSIAESACPTCSNITYVVKRSVAVIQEALEKIDPNWETNPIWKAVFTLVNSVLEIVSDFCPTTEVALAGPTATSGNGSCLTPEQEKQLKESINTIRDLFRTAIVALDIAYVAEKFPPTKKNIGIAITVLQAVNEDILSNLTAIAESACPTCSNITNVVKESVAVIEETLEKIDPNWQNNPIWKAVFTLVKALLSIVSAFCPTGVVGGRAVFSNIVPPI